MSSSSNQSPVPPPQSPLVKLGEEKLKSQLELEELLRVTSESLLEEYKGSRQWRQVCQLANSLETNTERITCIQDCLSTLETAIPLVTVPAATADDFVVSGLQIDSPPTGKNRKMLGEELTVCVKRTNNGKEPCWQITNTISNATVSRTDGDVRTLLHELNPDNGEVTMDTPEALCKLLNERSSLVDSFLSPEVTDFSSILAPQNESTKVCIAGNGAVDRTGDQDDKVTTCDDTTVNNGGDDPTSCEKEVIKNIVVDATPTFNDVIDISTNDVTDDVPTNKDMPSNDDDVIPTSDDVIPTSNDVTSFDDIPANNITNDTPTNNEISNDTPINNHVTTDTPINDDVTINTPTTNHITTDTPINDVTTDIPTNSNVTTDTPTNDVTTDTPTNDVTTDTPTTNDITTDIPNDITTTDTFAKNDVTTDTPTTNDITNDTPIKNDITNDTPTNNDVTTDIPTTNDITNDTPADDSGTADVGNTVPITNNDVTDILLRTMSETFEIDEIQSTDSNSDNTENIRSPKNSSVLITSASNQFIKPVTEEDDKSPAAILSDVDSPLDISSSEGVLTRSDDMHTSCSNEDFKLKLGTVSESVVSETDGGGRSTFFVDATHSAVIQSKSEPSPKDKRRNKSHSVFYSASSPSPPPSDQDKTSKLSNKLKRSFKRSNKIKKEVSTDDGGGAVSLMAPQLATEWDPTCILEEVYSDCRPVVPCTATDDGSRYSGYLDKLPVNHSKPAVMKGWKHRYFKVMRGSLFYYDDERSQKAISFVRLTDAKIIMHQEGLKVEIIEKNGNFIFLRAETKNNVVALHRALQLESIHPTLTHRLSVSPSRTAPIIIIDLGSCSVRAGLHGDENYPQLFFPNVCAFHHDKLVACGNTALLPHIRGSSKLVYPRRHRVRMDSTISVRECFVGIVEEVCKKLGMKPENCNMLVSISSLMPESEQQILAEVVLETLGFQGLLLQEQTTLALFSYNCTTGVSINVGDSISVVPILDGYKVEGADQHIPVGGANVTESLSKLASARDVRYFSDTEMYIVRHIKETLCFVSQDYFEDADKCDHSPHEYTRAADVDRFQLPDHKKVIALDLALFKAPEGLFQPAICGRDVLGIHEMVHKAIELCPLDSKRELCRNIYLSGGTSLMAGFPERLKNELSKLLPRIEIVVHGNEDRYHAAYLGAGILASLSTFQKSLVSQDDWISEGFDAFKQNR